MYKCIINEGLDSEVIIPNVQYVNENWLTDELGAKMTLAIIIQDNEKHLQFLKQYESILPPTYQVDTISIYKIDNSLMYSTDEYDFPASISIITESTDQGVFKGIIEFKQFKNKE